MEMAITRNDHTRGLDVAASEDQPLAGLVGDPHAGREEEPGLEEGREVLDLPMAVEVIAVRRLRGGADRPEGHQRGEQVDARVRRLGEDADGPGGETDHHLHAGEDHRRAHRAEGDQVLLALRGGVMDGDHRFGAMLARRMRSADEKSSAEGESTTGMIPVADGC
jgi:hypothetical protein